MVENNTPESLGIHLVNLKPDSFDGDILSFEKLFFIIIVSPFPIYQCQNVLLPQKVCLRN